MALFCATLDMVSLSDEKKAIRLQSYTGWSGSTVHCSHGNAQGILLPGNVDMCCIPVHCMWCIIAMSKYCWKYT